MNVCMRPIPLVFDLDGTLIDSVPDIHASVNAVLRENGLQTLSQSQVRSFVGGGVEVLWRRICDALRIDARHHGDLVAGFMARYHHATSLTRLYPGVTEALGQLADRGHPLGICTNKPLRATEAVLDHFGLRSLFGVIVGGDSLPWKKPDPAPLRAALSALGADPDAPQAWYVGDSEYDAQCAEAARTPFLIYTRGYRLAPLEHLHWHATFDDFAALPGLIEQHSLV